MILEIMGALAVVLAIWTIVWIGIRYFNDLFTDEKYEDGFYILKRRG